MANYRLILVNTQNITDENFVNVPMEQGIPMSTNYEVMDITNPDKRTGDFSKTVLIPGTKEVNAFFESVYDVNVNLQKFNPNLKIEAYYYKNELLQFSGRLRVIDIIVDEIAKSQVYECNILGQALTLFVDIKDKNVNELDFSLYNHTFNDTDIVNSFTNTIRVAGVPATLGNGVGYRYPVVDWGTNNSNTNNTRASDLKPYIFAHQIWNKILSDAGYTYTSTFIDSAFFKSLIVNLDGLPKLDATALNNNKFNAVSNGSQPILTLGLAGISNLTYSSSMQTTVQFPVENYDSGNVYNNGSFIYTPSISNKYNVNVAVGVKLNLYRNAVNINASVGGTVIPQSGYVTINLLQGTTIIGTGTIGAANLTYGSTPNIFSITLNTKALVAGQNYKVVFIFNQILYTNSLGAATYTLDCIFDTGTFESALSSDDVYYGQPVTMNNLLPNMQQAEFLANIRKRHNLCFMIDKNNPNNLIIEPWDSFFFSTAKNMTKKKDASKLRVVTPLGDLDFKTIKMSHAQGGDYYNKLYADQYKETYGQYDETIVNDFVQGERFIQDTFESTCIAEGTNKGMPVTTIINRSDTAITQFKPKYHMLIWSGYIALPTTKWSYTFEVSSTALYGVAYYPFAGHVDNPFAPTVDINYGLPNKIYYTYQAQTWTDNNLRNKHYSKMINQTTDKNSKLIKEYFFLDEKDINELDFRYPWFVDDAYYYINKVVNHDPTSDDSTEVHLVKLTAYQDFSPQTFEFNGGLNDNSSQNKAINNNLDIGGNNTNLGNSSLINGGSGNFIELGAESIQLTNCTNVTVLGNVVGFVGVGLSNVVIDESFNNSTITAPSPPITITSDTTFNSLYHNKTVYIDATSNDITLTWDAINMSGTTINFIRDDASVYNVYITDVGGYGTETFIGNALPYNLGLVRYEATPLTSKLDTIYLNY